MRLMSFSATGYRNLEQVELTDLADINVIHGDNNVGKSNLLDAILTLFRSFRIARYAADGEWRDVEARSVVRELGTDSPMPVGDSSAPVILKAQVSGLIKALRDRGFDLSGTELDDVATLECEIRRFGGGLRLRCGIEGLELHGEEAGKVTWQDMCDAVFGVDEGSVASGFALVDATRRRVSSVYNSDASRPAVGQLSPSLESELYSCRDSVQPSLLARWRRLRKAVQRFDDLVDGAVLDVVFPRNEEPKSAHLVLDRTDPSDDTIIYRLRLDQHGTGIQQLVSVLAHLLMARAPIVALEEPELNLRYELQLRLRDTLTHHLVGKTGGVTQLFLTSHSPAFEVGTHFYGMRRVNGRVEVQREDRSKLASYLGDAGSSSPEGFAPQSYLTSDGLLQVPDFARAALRLGGHGGLVVFTSRDEGVVEIASLDSVAARLED